MPYLRTKGAWVWSGWYSVRLCLYQVICKQGEAEPWGSCPETAKSNTRYTVLGNRLSRVEGFLLIKYSAGCLAQLTRNFHYKQIYGVRRCFWPTDLHCESEPFPDRESIHKGYGMLAQSYPSLACLSLGTYQLVIWNARIWSNVLKYPQLVVPVGYMQHIREKIWRWGTLLKRYFL